jgi:dTDP-4-dehydrorhamnose reductase
MAHELVAVTGAGGHLGKLTCLCLSEAGYEAVGWDKHAMDITDSDAVRTQISALKPDWVIHAAAYTKVDDAESDTTDRQSYDELDPQGHVQ